MPPTMAAPLQRPPHPAVPAAPPAAPTAPALDWEDLDVPRRALALMRELTVAPSIRDRLDAHGHRERRHQWLRTDGRRGIQLAIQDAGILLAAGASRAEVTLLPVLLFEVIDELCDERGPDGGVGGDRLALELANMRLDAEEDLLQGRAIAEVESPEEMLARAHALRKEASAKMALARQLEGIVRRRTLGLMRRVT